MDELELSALHEAGHAIVGDLLGRKITLITAESGEYRTGCCWSRSRYIYAAVPDVDTPLLTWAPEWGHRLAVDAAVAMAGGMAEAMFAPRVAGRVPLTVADETGDRLHDLAAATDEELEQAAVGVNTEGKTDADTVAMISFTAHGGDWQRTGAWLGWVETETAELLRANESKVRRVASLLRAHGTLGEAAAARALGGGTP